MVQKVHQKNVLFFQESFVSDKKAKNGCPLSPVDVALTPLGSLFWKIDKGTSFVVKKKNICTLLLTFFQEKAGVMDSPKNGTESAPEKCSFFSRKFCQRQKSQKWMSFVTCRRRTHTSPRGSFF